MTQVPLLILEDKRDLQFGNMYPVALKWASFAEAQKKKFMGALNHGLQQLVSAEFVDPVLKRGGVFVKAGDGVMSETEITRFKTSWARSLAREERVYATELTAYRSRHPDPVSSRYALVMADLMQDAGGAAARPAH